MDTRPDIEGWNLFFFFRSTSQVFTSVTGIYVLFGFAILMVLAHLGRWRWFILGFALYTSSMCFDWTPYFHTYFLPGFELMVENGRPLTAALMVILGTTAFLGLNDVSFKSLSRYGPLMYFVFQIVFCLRLIIGGVITRGVANFFTDVLVFWIAVIGTSQWMRRHRDVSFAAWSIAMAGVFFAIVTAIHAVLVPNQIMWQHRLISTSGTATFSSEICAITLLPVCYFVARPSLAKIVRVFMGVIAALLVVFLIWSGTRTGALMAVIGLLFLFRLKIGRWFVGGIVVCTFVWIALQFFGDALIGAGRLLSTQDTRSGTWLYGLSEFLANPIFGTIRSDVQVVENSYISIASRMGVVGMLLFAIIIFQIVSGLVGLHRMRKSIGARTMDIDLITAGIVSLGVGAVFEGYLLAAINVQLTSLFIYMTMMCTLLDPAKADISEAQLEPAEIPYDADYSIVAGSFE